MIAEILHRGLRFSADLSRPIDLSRPVRFDGQGVSAFGLGQATATAFDAGGHVLDTQQGAAVNCFGLHVNAHGHGTHTESNAHIGPGRNVNDVAPRALMMATLITAVPHRASEINEKYIGRKEPNDLLVTAQTLAGAPTWHPAADALIIRTRAAGTAPIQDFSGRNPPYLTSEAVDLLTSRGIRHLIVDLPSVDREQDGGTTPNHRAFWSPQPGDKRTDATITELAHVPDDAPDGLYLLALHVAPMRSDAAPSRPMVYPIIDGPHAA